MELVNYTKFGDVHRPRGYFLVTDYSLNVALFQTFSREPFVFRHCNLGSLFKNEAAFQIHTDILKRNCSYILKRAVIVQSV
jgi:hypothetical protein